MMTETETWICPDSGRHAHLIPVPMTADDIDDAYEWYPEEAGQRPPQAYEMHVPRIDGTKLVIAFFTVFPVEPWSAYDAISDKLRRYGWVQVNPYVPETCEHGLSADLCSGPNHY